MRAPRPAGSADFDVVGIGEISVDDVVRLETAAPAWGDKLAARGRDRLGGGQVATAMVALSRLGLRTAVIGAVGDDEAGDAAMAGLRDEGVDTQGVLRVAGARTRTAVVVVDGAGDRTVISDEDPRLAAALARGLDEERLRLCGAARVVHADATFPRVACDAAERARREQRAVSCDLERADEAAAALLPLVDLGLLAASFAARGADGFVPPRVAPGGVVVMTVGEQGAIGWPAEGGVLRQRAFAVRPVVDTTACGDTFRAGFLCAWLDGGDLGDCLRFGCAAAALKVRDLGRRGCPRRPEVEALLREAA